VERIKQGLANRRARGEKIGGRTPNKAKHALILKHLNNPVLTVGDVAKLAGCGVATVYRVKKSLVTSDILNFEIEHNSAYPNR
jgi:DNA invertase Pin-like site-specific DNA recombinase